LTEKIRLVAAQWNPPHKKKKKEKKMEQILKEACDRFKERLDELEKKYEASEIDASSFALSATLARLEKKIAPYHEELQKLDIKMYGHFELIIHILSSKHLTPKEEQQAKVKLKIIKDIFNEFDGSKDKKKQDIADVFTKIEDLLLEFTGPEIWREHQ
jgi:thiol-disulfide isomerase/thioredoxin